MSFQSEMVEKVEFLGISLGFYHASHMQGNRWRMGGWVRVHIWITGQTHPCSGSACVVNLDFGNLCFR